MPTHSHGRHEHGQNFLVDAGAITELVAHVAATDGPIVEIGPGDGALTRPMARLGRHITAVEIDHALAARLRREVGGDVLVIHGDALRHRLPDTPHVVVGNLPFHLTTAMLRTLLRAPGWTDAVLVVQWEVARRRAGIGTSTMMTAQWSPWFEFSVSRRVPAHAFSPRPGVDGGILLIRRRRVPLLDAAGRSHFQAMVHRVYTGRGRGVREILTRARIFSHPGLARTWCRRAGVSPDTLPSGLSPDQWIDLFTSSSARPPRRSG